MIDWLFLPLAFALSAALYAAVGHGGASAYLAVLALAGIPPALTRPLALIGNLCVAGLGTWRFARVGHVPWRVLLPFVVTSVPAAWLGGRLHLDPALAKRLLGGVLLWAALTMVWRCRRDDPLGDRGAPLALALPIGAALGFLSGLIGIGGGIFLSPLLLLTGWATTRSTAGVSAAFILVNSAAGLLGQWPQGLPALPAAAPLWLAAAVAGGAVGSWAGARRLPPPALRALLAGVLVLAAVKLLLV